MINHLAFYQFVWNHNFLSLTCILSLPQVSVLSNFKVFQIWTLGPNLAGGNWGLQELQVMNDPLISNIVNLGQKQHTFHLTTSTTKYCYYV